MKNTKNQKTNEKHQGKVADEKQKDESVIQLIRCLDVLVSQAKLAKLGIPARMINNAKEDLVYWASDNFPESTQEKFINQHLFDNTMPAGIELLTKFVAITDSELRRMLLSRFSENTQI